MLALVEITWWHWVGFIICVLVLLFLDLGVFHRQAHVVSFKESLVWTSVWFCLAMLFALGIKKLRGDKEALEFVTGYLIELSLSMDNVFVIALIFGHFLIPSEHQHRVLFWGILGALVMRGALIAVGAALLKEFHWVIYIFGAFLIFTGIRMALHRGEDIHPDQNPVVKFFRKFVPVTENYEKDKFFVRRAGRLMATPLFLTLLIVESTDLVFAVDSIPAIFAVTQEPFIVYTSNVFAILGLRALYFLLANVMDKFQYLKLGLSAVLTFIGGKMLIMDLYHIPVGLSLGIVASILTISILASLWKAKSPLVS